MFLLRSTVAAFFMGLVACGSSDPVAAPVVDLSKVATAEVCDSLFPPGSVIEADLTTCPGCTIDSLSNAIDGDYETLAVVNFAQTPSGSFTLRVTAPTGSTMNGDFAGAFLGRPMAASGFAVATQLSVLVTTFLAGTPQDTTAPSNEGPNVGAFRELFSLRGVVPTKPYDTVQFRYEWRESPEPALVRFSEFCSAAQVFTGGDEPARTPTTTPPSAQADSAGLYTVDLLLLYTTRFLRSAGNAATAEAEAHRLVAEANSYFVNSNVPIRYAVRDVRLYSGASETLDSRRVLYALQADPYVKAVRNLVGADVTALLATKDFGYDLCGISTPFNHSVQSAFADDVDPDMDGYVTVGAGAGMFNPRCANHTLAHELGHVLAAGHQAGPLTNGAYWKPYSHAWTCGKKADGTDQPTIMATESDGAVFFSSPLIFRDGAACGQAGTEGVESTQADNARVMIEAVPYVAAYR